MQTSAPGKLILCGEHAVVYGQPAIAVPLTALRASVEITAAARGAGLTIAAPDLGAVWRLRAAVPMSDLAERTLAVLGLGEPDATLTIRSTIPLASGMGSGAAVGVALVRALSRLADQQLDAATISALVYESERTFHGTPSGIDNTVIAYEQPIWFQRRVAGPPQIEPLQVGTTWTFVVGDTGRASATKAVVGDLRRRWQAESAHYADLFAQTGAVVGDVRAALAGADGAALGDLLNTNQHLLTEIGVSSPELATLIGAARRAGAWGAKLSGAGWGGIMIALVASERAADVAAALRQWGAVRTWTTNLATS